MKALQLLPVLLRCSSAATLLSLFFSFLRFAARPPHREMGDRRASAQGRGPENPRLAP